jgi:hypothetical protein
MLARVIKYKEEGKFKERWGRMSEKQRSIFLESLNDIKVDFMDDVSLP